MDTFKADIQKYLALNDRQTQLNREVAQIRNQKNNFEKNILDFGEKHRLMGKSLKIKQQKLVFEEQPVKKVFIQHISQGKHLEISTKISTK